MHSESQYLQPSGYTRRASTFTDREFQLKYTRYLLWMSGFITLIFLLPPFYYSFENYHIFINLADLNDPQLTHYLMSERFYLAVYFVAAAVAQFGFWFLFSKRMSAKIVGPAKLLRNHVRLLSRGDFTLPVLRVREDDEFKELVSSYNYLYTLLKTQYQSELEDLKSLQKIVTQPAALALLNEMVDVRERRLGLTSSSPVSKPATSHDSRHAS